MNIIDEIDTFWLKKKKTFLDIDQGGEAPRANTNTNTNTETKKSQHHLRWGGTLGYAGNQAQPQQPRQCELKESVVKVNVVIVGVVDIAIIVDFDNLGEIFCI